MIKKTEMGIEEDKSEEDEEKENGDHRRKSVWRRLPKKRIIKRKIKEK